MTSPMSGAVLKSDEAANWVWLSLIPMGLGAWAPVYAGVRTQNRRWVAIGLAWSLITVAGWTLAGVNHGGGLAGLLIILGWCGAVASSFTIRPAYRRELGSSFEAAREGAESRLAAREQARRLAQEKPALALEMGVGRPDLPGAQAAGLVDVNNAPAAVLASLPGIDDALATRIVEARAETHGFSSVEDVGLALDLDGRLVEDLRDRTVFLPR